MSKRRLFEIVFDTDALDHMAAIERKYDSLIRRAIDEQLAHEPDTPTRNRKLLLREATVGATWELRCGPDNRFRVFYDAHANERLVVILAIARKVGNDLLVGKEKFEL